ncbi:hypothetical protein TRICI_002230 [Trichomonascus ciferrii]|uniref:Very long-chain fatty acid transport protein n=1 Tax=Trichomonascus ciferrii TaxID=44093 RepID=A0A642VC59_9ASCO|nr:hypothetical protein TRICI_002230 [Trichomonascus ciferrii]
MVTGAELAGLGALAAAYLDAKHMVRDDLKTARKVVKLWIDTYMSKWRGQMNFFFIIEHYARKQPNSLALVYPRQISTDYPKDRKASLDHLFKVERYTYGEMYEMILKYAAVLRNQWNVQPGDIVALDCMNNLDYIFIWFALWSLGATPAFINYNLKGNSLLHCIKIANTNLLVADPEISGMVTPVQKDIEGMGKQVLYLNQEFHQAVMNASPYRAPDAARKKNEELHDPAMLIYTSGTTGHPKSAVFSWDKAIIGAGSYNSAMNMSKKDITYSPMPLYHTTGAVLGVLAIMLKGGAFAIGHKFSARTFWTQAKLSNATYVQYVGETCRYLLNSPEGPDDKTHGVKAAIGNGIRPDVWPQFKERFNIRVIGELYGATEFPTALTNYQEGEWGIGAVSKYGSLLKRFLFRTRYTIAAIDPENPADLYRDPVTGFGRKADINEPGEFLFRIPDPKNVHRTFQGYHGNKQASDEKVVRDLFQKGDAYVRSGDLLKLDSHGLAYFVDRMGDTFRWKSENVSTNEVEEAFSDIPGVYQCVVVGVKVPHHEGRAGFVVIQPNDPNNPPDIEKIGPHVSNKLPPYAVPVFLKFTKTPLDNTGTNKVQKAKYRNQKIPSEDETIYWLKGNQYVELKPEDWLQVEGGRAKL